MCFIHFIYFLRQYYLDSKEYCPFNLQKGIVEGPHAMIGSPEKVTCRGG
jgi:hypothetical protein